MPLQSRESLKDTDAAVLGTEIHSCRLAAIKETSEAWCLMKKPDKVTEVDVGAVVPVACLNDMKSPFESDGFITSCPGPSTQKKKELLLSTVLLFLAHRLSGNNPPFACTKIRCHAKNHNVQRLLRGRKCLLQRYVWLRTE